MREYRIGDRSKGICPICKKKVSTTFCKRDLYLRSENGVVTNLLVGMCDICGQIISIPQQSVPSLKRALSKIEGVKMKRTKEYKELATEERKVIKLIEEAKHLVRESKRIRQKKNKKVRNKHSGSSFDSLWTSNPKDWERLDFKGVDVKKVLDKQSKKAKKKKKIVIDNFLLGFSPVDDNGWGYLLLDPNEYKKIKSLSDKFVKLTLEWSE